MQGGRDPFFNPFGNFGGFGNGPSDLSSHLFGGRNPFDDPFFTRPFGNMDPFFTRPFGNMESSLFGPSISSFAGPRTSGFLENQPSQPNRSTGVIIEELNSDDEKEEEEAAASKEQKGNPRKHSRSSKEPIVEIPDDKVEGKKRKQLQISSGFNQARNMQSQPQSHSLTFQSSTVSYGGANGTYYTSSTTRRSGSDGLSFEESKEANSATRQASHKVSMGIHDKGHSVTRKLTSDGRVETMQMLHNLNQDELVGFDEAWKRSSRECLPGWSEELRARGSIGLGTGPANWQGRGGWALPAANQAGSINSAMGYHTRNDQVNVGSTSRGRSRPQGMERGTGLGRQAGSINSAMGYRASNDPSLGRQHAPFWDQVNVGSTSQGRGTDPGRQAGSISSTIGYRASNDPLLGRQHAPFWDQVNVGSTSQGRSRTLGHWNQGMSNWNQARRH